VEVTDSETIWHGKPARVVIVRDISERKRNEEQARQQQQQLMIMDKLTSLGVLAAGMAHEINNPNQTILSNASFLVRACPMILSIFGDYNEDHNDFLVAGFEYEEFQKSLPELIGGIKECSDRIDGIVKNLKTFSKNDPGDLMTRLDINVVVRAAIKLLEHFIKKATKHFILRLENDIPRVKGNAQRLEQVIINLILNGCQALTDRGQLISVRSLYSKNRNKVIIEVSDEGTGIPEEHMEKIKTPFFTTKRAHGGTGLGLHVSESIVREHKGTLSFDSFQGKGTVATISLPVEEDI
jgi:signal transduction histidine kinase